MAKNKNPLMRAEEAPRAGVGASRPPGGNPCGKKHAKPPEACRRCVLVLNELVALRATHKPGRGSRSSTVAHLDPQRAHTRRRGRVGAGDES
jgi:hypothetical protein